MGDVVIVFSDKSLWYRLAKASGWKDAENGTNFMATIIATVLLFVAAVVLCSNFYNMLYVYLSRTHTVPIIPSVIFALFTSFALYMVGTGFLLTCWTGVKQCYAFVRNYAYAGDRLVYNHTPQQKF